MIKYLVITLSLFFMLSQNMFSQWESTLSSQYVWTICGNGNKLYAGSNGLGFYISNDSGATWIHKDTAMAYLGSNVAFDITSLATVGNRVFVGTYGYGILMSTDDGNSWSRKNTGLTNPIDSNILTITVDGKNLFAGTDDGIFLSTDYGETWNKINKGLDVSKGYLEVFSLAIKDSNIFAATSSGVYVTEDYGENWTQKNNGLTDTFATSILIYNNYVYAGTPKQGIFISTDNGENWSQRNNGLIIEAVRSLITMGDNIFAGLGTAAGFKGGVYISTNEGENWINITADKKVSSSITLYIYGDYIFSTSYAIYKAKLSDLMVLDVDNSFDNNDSNITVYPNISNSYIKIKFMNLKYKPPYLKEGLIYNYLGLLVKRFPINLNESDLNIDISALPSGRYFIIINENILNFVKY